MDYKKLAEDYYQSLMGLSPHHAHRKMGRAVKGEMYALQFIYEKGGDVLPSQIAEQMQVSSARIAATLGTLEEKGLVTRQTDEQDRRRVRVSLTEKGIAQTKENYQKMIEKISEILRALGPEDANHLVRILDKMRAMCPHINQTEEKR